MAEPMRCVKYKTDAILPTWRVMPRCLSLSALFGPFEDNARGRFIWGMASRCLGGPWEDPARATPRQVTLGILYKR